jgi:DNA-binding beta-propeller fold protein YncE
MPVRFQENPALIADHADFMTGVFMARFLFAGVLLVALAGAAQAKPLSPYHVIDNVKPGGDGGWDYLFADAGARRLYIPRSGPDARITLFDLDTLKPVGAIPGFAAHGVAIDAKSHHGFASSNPVVMWDTGTLHVIKTIAVAGHPDSIVFDRASGRVFVFSHSAPNATVIDAASGGILSTIDLGGAPEEAVSDDAGHVFVDLEDKNQVVAIDTAMMKVSARFDLDGKGGGPGALAIDAKNHILFAACHDPATMVILDSRDGKILAALPIGKGVDSAGFNPETLEAFSSQGDGTLTVIKESDPSHFAVEQTVQTMPGARTMTLDTKNGRVFTVSAQFAPPPSTGAPAAGHRPRRGPMIPGSFSILAIGR